MVDGNPIVFRRHVAADRRFGRGFVLEKPPLVKANPEPIQRALEVRVPGHIALQAD